MNDLDWADALLEKRSDLLASSGGMLAGCIRASRLMTLREQDAWNWAIARITELEDEFSVLAASLAQRRYDLSSIPMKTDGHRHKT